MKLQASTWGKRFYKISVAFSIKITLFEKSSCKTSTSKIFEDQTSKFIHVTYSSPSGREMGRKAFHGKISLILKRHLSFYLGWYSRIYQKVVGKSVKHKLFLKRMLCYLATRNVWKNRQKERIYPKHGTWEPPWVCHNVLSQLFNSKTLFYQYSTQIFKFQS